MKLTHKDMPKGYYGYVYKITNLSDGRNYVGQHKLTNLNEPFLYYMGSSKDLSRDISTLQMNNFQKEIIEFAKTGLDLAKLENDYIRLFKAAGKAEYNKSLWLGSIACIYCEESFTNPSSLRSHRSKEHGILDKEECRFCFEMITRGAGMAAHLRGKHPHELGLIPEVCSICGEKSFLNGFQTWHFNERHAEKIECQKCNQAFVKPKFFLKHQEDSPCSRGELLCDCGERKECRSEMCNSCDQQRRRDELPRFSKDKIIEDLKQFNGNFTKLSKEYGVTDNAIRKWLKKYNLSIRSRDYRNASVYPLASNQLKG